MRPFVIAASMLAAGSLAAQAQSSSNRLMFDPNGLGTERRTFAPQSATPQPAPSTSTTTMPSANPPATTGQTAQQQQPAPRPVTAQQAQPAPKQAAPTSAPRAAANPPARRAPQAERTISDTAAATAASRSSTDRPVPREQQNLGRVSLPQGSLGYESKTQMQTYDMSDGRRVPGYDNIQRNNSSYFGLSLRMPTFDSPSSSSSSSSPSSSWSPPSAFGSHGAN